MKRVKGLLIACLVVALALGAVGCVQRGSQVPISVTTQQNTGIWVTGQGETMAVPDVAMLSLGVEAKAKTVTEAQSQAAVAMDAVMQVLKDNGIAEKDIQTQQYSIYPVTKWDEDRGQEIIAYRVTNVVVAKIRKVDKAGAIIDAVAQAGGDYTRIRSISFAVDDPIPYYEEARTKAIKNAENKAKQLANLTGVRLGEATYISEGAIYPPPIARGAWEYAAAPASATETPISPGELKVTVSVQVAYAIV